MALEPRPGEKVVFTSEMAEALKASRETEERDTPMVFVTDNNGDPNQFINKARELVLEKYNRDIADLQYNGLITLEEIYVVWFSKVLDNWKALVSTDRSDGRYYELTYNGAKQETYVDVYSKDSNEVITDASR